jgi:L-alanine-DL-glutamate epimerase-like enolase superfamily enzyme
MSPAASHPSRRASGPSSVNHCEVWYYVAFTANHLQRESDGRVRAPDARGLSIAIDPAGVRKYLVDVEFQVGGKALFASTANL